MNRTEEILQHAEQQCQTQGSRFTIKRKHILSALLDSQRALSAYEIVDYCKENFNEKLPAMSVYRILDFLQQSQLVHKLSLANKFVACSHITCQHEHKTPQFLICNECQKVQEIGIDTELIKTLEQNVTQAGFHLVSPQLEMNCLCEACQVKMA